jgi:hypothetical protein
MLSPIHSEQLKNFSSRVDRMMKLSDVSELQSSFLELNSEFSDRIMSLSSSLDVNPQWQSYLTEMHKQMRLLQTELMFLRSHRQPDKVLERLARVRQCLAKLQDYCNYLMSDR